MSKDWYSLTPRTRFSREHREIAPLGARMIDLDQVMWIPYEGLGTPAMLIELKPERAKEDFWIVTRSLAKLAGLPAAKVIEQAAGDYAVYVASDKTGYEPHLVSKNMTMLQFYEQVELPLRSRVIP